jgi:hypothetical protein
MSTVIPLITERDRQQQGEPHMLVPAGNALRSGLTPVLAPAPLVLNTVGFGCGVAGGSALYGLSILGNVAPNTVHALSGR